MPQHAIYYTTAPAQADHQQAMARLFVNGPRLNIEISVPDALAQTLTTDNRTIPQPEIGAALLDTGASNTCIDITIAQKLGLQIVNRIKMRTPSDDDCEQDVYAAKLAFPGTTLPPLPLLNVAGAKLANQGLAALIGRDFLLGKTLHYDGHLSIVKLIW